MSYFEADDAVRTMLRRAAIKKVEDKGSQQIVTATGLKDEEFKIVRAQTHGFSSNPPVGSEGWVTALGGRSDRLQFHAGEHEKHRPRDTPSGGSVVYDDKGNVSRYLGDDGIWHNAGERPQKMTGKVITITGSDKVVVSVDGTTVTVRAGRVDLGGEGGSAVMTETGPSSVVFAKV